MAVYEKPPKRDVAPSRGRHRRDLIAEYNKRYTTPAAGESAPPPGPDDKKP